MIQNYSSHISSSSFLCVCIKVIMHVFTVQIYWLLTKPGLVQDCGISSAYALEIPQSCTKLSISSQLITIHQTGFGWKQRSWWSRIPALDKSISCQHGKEHGNIIGLMKQVNKPFCFPAEREQYKMAAISQTISSDAFSWMKSFVFWLKFHWSLFLRVQLTIIKHWFK